MKGLELAEKYYALYGKEAIKKAFPDYENQIAVGLVGEGSECYGYDDDVSSDHDFEPRFFMWIPRSLEKEIGFRLERLYAKLPKELDGYKVNPVAPVGETRRGVSVIEDFYKRFLGTEDAPTSVEQWLFIPSCYLSEATNGKVFRDDSGVFSQIRQKIASYPEEIRLKKIASSLFSMGQSGQYNYGRSRQRKEFGAAKLALNEFVTSALECIHLINGKYCPFYKWAFRSLRELPLLAETEPALEYLLNESEENSDKTETVEELASLIIMELQKQNITDEKCNGLVTHAYSVNYKIKDGFLRNLPVPAGR